MWIHMEWKAVWLLYVRVASTDDYTVTQLYFMLHYVYAYSCTLNTNCEQWVDSGFSTECIDDLFEKDILDILEWYHFKTNIYIYISLREIALIVCQYTVTVNW